MLEQVFKVQESGSTVRAEVLGGLTTFAAMAYIIVVNPAILSLGGMPLGPSTVATILVAVIGCLVMAFYANRPYAVAPYMGENAFFAFGMAALGMAWPERLGAVFVGGVLFLALSLAGGRAWLVRGVSASLRQSFGVGIGLFLTFIGLYDTGIITGGGAGLPTAALALPNGTLRAPDVPVRIGDFSDHKVQLGIAGFVLTAVLLQRGIKGGLLIGIAVTAAVGLALGFGHAPTQVFAIPFSGEYALTPIFLKLNVAGVLNLAALPVILTLLVMAFFDTTGTLMGLSSMVTPTSSDADLRRPMNVDALMCCVAPLLGTTTSGVFIESATGVKEGARTGLATLVTGLLFLVSLFFIPLLAPVQQLTFAYGPALLLVGLLMLPGARNIAFDDLTEAVPAFASIAMMVFTYNIANGLTAGLVLWPLMKLLGGKAKEINAPALTLAVLCLVYFAFGLKH